MNNTITEIKPVVSNLEVLVQFGIELDLDVILAEEFETGLSSDISNGF
jgi:hypothetical protein